MESVATTTRTRKPAPRFLSLAPAAAGPGHLLTLKVGKDVDNYDLSEIPADDGRGFALVKLSVVPADLDDGDVYHVLVNGPHAGVCDCKGFARHGRCKH